MKTKLKNFIQRWRAVMEGLKAFRRDEVEHVIYQRKPESSVKVLKDNGVLVNTFPPKEPA